MIFYLGSLTFPDFSYSLKPHTSRTIKSDIAFLSDNVCLAGEGLSFGGGIIQKSVGENLELHFFKGQDSPSDLVCILHLFKRTVSESSEQSVIAWTQEEGGHLCICRQREKSKMPLLKEHESKEQQVLEFLWINLIMFKTCMEV